MSDHRPPSRYAAFNKEVRRKIKGGTEVTIVRKEKDEITDADRAFVRKQKTDWLVWCYLTGAELRFLGKELKIETKEELLERLDNVWSGNEPASGTPLSHPLLSGKPWTTRHDKVLQKMIEHGRKPSDVAMMLARTVEEVKQRRKELYG